MQNTNKAKTTNFKFPKSPTGIKGLDDITTGGLPKIRPTLCWVIRDAEKPPWLWNFL